MSVECCAYGCSSRSDLNPDIRFYQFPEEKERCHDWLDSIVREDLKQLPIEQICNEFYVCALHFDDAYLQSGTEGMVEEGISVQQIDADNKKEYEPEADDTTENVLLEDGKTQLVYVEGIGHIRLKTETDEVINVPTTETTSNDLSSNLRLVNNGKDYMLCLVDDRASQYVVKQTDDLLKVLDTGSDSTDLLGDAVTRVKCEEDMEVKEIDNADGVLDNFKNDVKALSYLCHSCGQNFENYTQLSTHMQKQHSGLGGSSVVKSDAGTNERSFQCNECKQVFTMFDQLKTHVRNHVQSRNFACDVCSAAFSHRSNLSRHKQQHCSAKKYQCDQCGKGFTQKSNLVTHQQTVHSAIMQLHTLSSLSRPGAERVHRKPKVHACNICGKSFVSLTGLKNHGALHTGERPFVCAMCNKSFTLMSCLKTHMATIHTGKKHFCELCGKSYQSEHYLKIHLRIHSGIKDFECESCSKRFIDLPSLKLHTRTHTGEKPFNCRVCSRSFTQQSHLKTHMRVHTGEKPYECKDCGKYFRQLSNVLEHSRTHRKPTN